MSQPDLPSQPARSKLPTALSIGLIIITVLSLAFAGYTLANPHSTAVTQQQFLTNTQSFYETRTLTSLSTVTNVVTTTSIASSNRYGYNLYQNCGYYGCYYSGPPGYSFNPPCQPSGNGNSYQCSGWLYRDGNGCVDLIIPVTDRFMEQVHEYYALHNLPSSYPPYGSWVTVTGQVYQAYNTGPNGASCPNNYINVVSITQ